MKLAGREYAKKLVQSHGSHAFSPESVAAKDWNFRNIQMSSLVIVSTMHIYMDGKAIMQGGRSPYSPQSTVLMLALRHHPKQLLPILPEKQIP